jgi:hypothetical protein
MKSVVFETQLTPMREVDKLAEYGHLATPNHTKSSPVSSHSHCNSQ